MDPYFRPILISTALVILLNTIFVLPIQGAPLFSYFIGGLVAVILFKKELKDKFEDVKTTDAAILGIGTGIVVGAVLTMIIAIKLQDVNMQRFVIDSINEAMKMRTESEFQMLEYLGPGFYVVTSIVTILICSLISLFGGLAVLPFVNKAKK
ncbi:MAG: hypothetical protein HOA17_02190 [Candidatus Melainabacteria bacterium]|jgi:hypothetical protein|nr:hypothetical protein [Candidatus Melainabacteria bacterium]